MIAMLILLGVVIVALWLLALWMKKEEAERSATEFFQADRGTKAQGEEEAGAR